MRGAPLSLVSDYLITHRAGTFLVGEYFHNPHGAEVWTQAPPPMMTMRNIAASTAVAFSFIFSTFQCFDDLIDPLILLEHFLREPVTLGRKGLHQHQPRNQVSDWLALYQSSTSLR